VIDNDTDVKQTISGKDKKVKDKKVVTISDAQLYSEYLSQTDFDPIRQQIATLLFNIDNIGTTYENKQLVIDKLIDLYDVSVDEFEKEFNKIIKNQ
jgi:hypothetical protein